MVDRRSGGRCRRCRGGRVPGARECSRTAHGESGWTGRLIPLTVDGLIYASSMAMLDSARRAPGFPRWLGGCSASASGIMVLLSTVARGP
jgi:hypothetical protein